MSVLPSHSAPFGFLEPIHRYLVDNAQPFNTATASVLNHSTGLLFLQAWLVQFPDTRLLRVAVGILGIRVSVATWSTVRFVEPWFDALNNGLGVGFLHNTFKLAVFAFIQEPVTVAYEAKGLWRLVAAIDIAFNSRWIGLRKLRYDGIKTEASVRVERQRQLVNRRTRVQSLSRHAAYASLYWIIFDIVVELIRALSWDTIGRSDPPPHALNRFVYHTAFVLLPNSRYAMSAPEWFMMALIKLLTGIAVWLSLSAGYHTFALVFIGSGMYAPDSWDRDTFDKPLKSDSLFDFWRRWHQLFTQHFSLVSTYILTTLGLPARSWLAAPIIFFLSGSMHALGQLSMTIPPDPLKVATFFWLSGAGICLEMLFRKITGKRVGGTLGRVWLWLFMYWSSTGALAAEYQSGLGGSKVCPAFIDALGRPVVGLVRRWVLDRADGGFQ